MPAAPAALALSYKLNFILCTILKYFTVILFFPLPLVYSMNLPRRGESLDGPGDGVARYYYVKILIGCQDFSRKKKIIIKLKN